MGAEPVGPQPAQAKVIPSGLTSSTEGHPGDWTEVPNFTLALSCRLPTALPPWLLHSLRAMVRRQCLRGRGHLRNESWGGVNRGFLPFYQAC